MDQLLEFLQGFNAQTLIGMGIMMWLFSRHIDSKIERLEAKFDEQTKRIDRFYEMFVDLRKEFHEEMRDFRKKVIE